MYEATPVDLSKCYRQTNGYLQGASQIERLPLVPLKNLIQGLAARVIDYEDRPPFATNKPRLCCPRRVEAGPEAIFVLESL
jgi:hypothetical protein